MKALDTRRLIQLTIDVGTILLFISFVLDLVLWATINYYIPSWTISLMSLGIIIILQVLRRILLNG